VNIELHDLKRTPEGYVKGRARVTGESVLDYSEIHGISIYRPADEVFDQASMDSLKMIPLTIGHPPENLTTANALNWSIGSTGSDVQQDGNSLTVDFSIVDQGIAEETYARHEAGQRVQFSVGAVGLPEYKEGEYNGMAYQAILRQIRYNHLALLLDQQGRYPATQITDSKMYLSDAQLITVTKTNREKPKMQIELPNGYKIEVSDADAVYIQNHLTEHKDLKTKYSEVSGANKTLEKQLNDAKTKVLDATGLNNAISTRLELALEAHQFLDSVNVSDLAAMSDREIQEAVLIEDGHTADSLKTEDAATIRGMYRQLVKSAGQQTSASLLDTAARVSSKHDGGMEIADAYGDAMKKRQEKMNKGAN
jgi:hypothetical protein